MTAILCAVDGCTQSKSSKGWCAKHYQRWLRHGDPLGNPAYNYDRATPDTSIEDRFWSKVDKNGPVPINRADLGSCWIWTRALTSAGYGAFNLPQVDDRRRQDFAHIWSWKRYVGPIPKGYHLDHLCHTVDPPATQAQHPLPRRNVRLPSAVRSDLQPSHEHHPTAKPTTSATATTRTSNP